MHCRAAEWGGVQRSAGHRIAARMVEPARQAPSRPMLRGGAHRRKTGPSAQPRAVQFCGRLALNASRMSLSVCITSGGAPASCSSARRLARREPITPGAQCSSWSTSRTARTTTSRGGGRRDGMTRERARGSVRTCLCLVVVVVVNAIVSAAGGGKSSGCPAGCATPLSLLLYAVCWAA